MVRPDKPFIFVSYSSTDEDVVHPEIKRLQSQGYQVWYDKGELTAGNPWHIDIRAALGACTCFVLFVTRSSMLSKNVREEMDQAWEAEKPIICVYWEKVKMPGPFHGIQGVERYRLHTPDYQEQLSKALSKHMQKPDPLPEEKSRDTMKAPVPVSLVTAPGISPKAIRFILILVAVIFFLFALSAIIAPYFVAENPSDVLSSRLAASLTGGAFIVLAAGTSLTAFIVHRKYLRRKND